MGSIPYYTFLPASPHYIHFLPQEPKPSASSKMMMGWLKSSTPSKRKEPDTGKVKQEGHTGETRPEKQPKTAGPLQQWLQGPSKKPRTNWVVGTNIDWLWKEMGTDWRMYVLLSWGGRAQMVWLFLCLVLVEDNVIKRLTDFDGPVFCQLSQVTNFYISVQVVDWIQIPSECPHAKWHISMYSRVYYRFE